MGTVNVREAHFVTFVNMWTVELCTIQALLMCLHVITFNCGYN